MSVCGTNATVRSLLPEGMHTRTHRHTYTREHVCAQPCPGEQVPRFHGAAAPSPPPGVLGAPAWTRPVRSSPDWCQCPGGDAVQRPELPPARPHRPTLRPSSSSQVGRLPLNVLRMLMPSVSQQTDTKWVLFKWPRTVAGAHSRHTCLQHFAMTRWALWSPLSC